MIDKRVASLAEAIGDLRDGASVMVGGFGEAGEPTHLLQALREHGARELTIIANGAGSANQGCGILIDNRQVSKLICSFPVSRHARELEVFWELRRSGRLEVEISPQGTLAERIRAGGAGIPAFYTPTGVGTIFAEGKDVRTFDGRPCLLETALTADYAFVRAARADRFGNLVYRRAQRNFNPAMAMAARTTVAEVYELVEAGELDPEHVVTPGIFVDRVVRVDDDGPARLARRGVRS